MQEARKFADEFTAALSGPLRIAEIGSQDVNGSLRSIFADHEYIGFDIEAGPGVDVVLFSPEAIAAAADSFDVALSANCLEHTRRPWLVVKEMARIIRPGGLVFLLMPMPNAHRYHAHPIDCWRCYTEGMRGLLENAGLEVLDLYEAADHDTVGIGCKPE